MTLEPTAAEKTLFAVAPDGTEHSVVLRVGIPERRPDGLWSASVSLGALDSHPSSIYGDDSWQAIQLAMRFIATRVGHFGNGGWQFFWERGGDAFPPSELLRWGTV